MFANIRVSSQIKRRNQSNKEDVKFKISLSLVFFPFITYSNFFNTHRTLTILFFVFVVAIVVIIFIIVAGLLSLMLLRLGSLFPQPVLQGVYLIRHGQQQQQLDHEESRDQLQSLPPHRDVPLFGRGEKLHWRTEKVQILVPIRLHREAEGNQTRGNRRVIYLADALHDVGEIIILHFTRCMFSRLIPRPPSPHPPLQSAHFFVSFLSLFIKLSFINNILFFFHVGKGRETEEGLII